MQENERALLQANVEALNHNKTPIFILGGYAVLERLGSGAFGSVYKVQLTPSILVSLPHESLGPQAKF